MARVRFIADYDYKVTDRAVIGYLAEMVVTVRRDCADKAVACGKAELLAPPKRGEGDAETALNG